MNKDALALIQFQVRMAPGKIACNPMTSAMRREATAAVFVYLLR
jgi:hypothetical protein